MLSWVCLFDPGAAVSGPYISVGSTPPTPSHAGGQGLSAQRSQRLQRLQGRAFSRPDAKISAKEETCQARHGSRQERVLTAGRRRPRAAGATTCSTWEI